MLDQRSRSLRSRPRRDSPAACPSPHARLLAQGARPVTNWPFTWKSGRPQKMVLPGPKRPAQKRRHRPRVEHLGELGAHGDFWRAGGAAGAEIGRDVARALALRNSKRRRAPCSVRAGNRARGLERVLPARRDRTRSASFCDAETYGAMSTASTARNLDSPAAAVVAFCQRSVPGMGARVTSSFGSAAFKSAAICSVSRRGLIAKAMPAASPPQMVKVGLWQIRQDEGDGRRLAPRPGAERDCPPG